MVIIAVETSSIMALILLIVVITTVRVGIVDIAIVNTAVKLTTNIIVFVTTLVVYMVMCI